MTFMDFLLEGSKDDKKNKAKKKMPADMGYGKGGDKDPKTHPGYQKKSTLANLI